MQEQIQQIIEELKPLIDKLPKEANWFGNVDQIKHKICQIEALLNNQNSITDQEYNNLLKVLYHN